MLQLSRQVDPGDALFASVNQLYHAIMTWLKKYQKWCAVMKELKFRYMLPLMKAIVASPNAVAEIKEFRKGKIKALAAIEKAESPAGWLADEKTIQALNLSARRRETGLKRSRTRYKREHTL